jgi:hypothetical protein
MIAFLMSLSRTGPRLVTLTFNASAISPEYFSINRQAVAHDDDGVHGPISLLRGILAHCWEGRKWKRLMFLYAAKMAWLVSQ